MGLLLVGCDPLNVACMFHKTFDQLISLQSVHTVNEFKKRGQDALRQGRQNLNQGWNVRRYSANQQWGGGKGKSGEREREGRDCSRNQSKKGCNQVASCRHDTARSKEVGIYSGTLRTRNIWNVI